jgi:chromosome segregation ATPase
MFTLLAQVDLSHAATATGIDVNQIAQLSGGNPLMVVVLGAVAVLGGKTLWDYLKKKQELQHEQKMEELKVSSTGHEQCVAKQEALESQVSSLKGKIVDLEGKAVTAEKKAEELRASSQESLEYIEDSLKKVKKKVKKVEELVEQVEKKGK